MKISHSRLNTFASCPRKYDLIYNEKMFPESDSAALSIGKAFHHGVEHKSVEEAEKYMDEDNFFLSEKNVTSQVLVIAMLGGYLEKYAEEKVIASEIELKIKVGSDEMTIIIDEIIERDGKIYLVDLKTASQAGDPDKYKSQLAKYFYGILAKIGSLPVDHIDGVIVKVVYKSKIRQKKTESIEEFRTRLSEEYKENAEKYFQEYELDITTVEIVDELINTTLWSILLKGAINLQIFPENKNSCDMYGACPYKPFCKKYAGAEALYVFKKEETVDDKPSDDVIKDLVERVEGLEEDMDILFGEEEE